MMHPPTISVQEASTLLGIGRTTGYDLVAQEGFPVAVIRVGRQIRVPLAPLADMLGLAAADLFASLSDTTAPVSGA